MPCCAGRLTRALQLHHDINGLQHTRHVCAWCVRARPQALRQRVGQRVERARVAADSRQRLHANHFECHVAQAAQLLGQRIQRSIRSAAGSSLCRRRAARAAAADRDHG